MALPRFFFFFFFFFLELPEHPPLQLSSLLWLCHVFFPFDHSPLQPSRHCPCCSLVTFCFPLVCSSLHFSRQSPNCGFATVCFPFDCSSLLLPRHSPCCGFATICFFFFWSSFPRQPGLKFTPKSVLSMPSQFLRVVAMSICNHGCVCEAELFVEVRRLQQPLSDEVMLRSGGMGLRRAYVYVVCPSNVGRPCSVPCARRRDVQVAWRVENRDFADGMSRRIRSRCEDRPGEIAVAVGCSYDAEPDRTTTISQN